MHEAMGPKLGAALGLVLWVAFTVDVSWYLLGFAQSYRSLSGSQSSTQVFPWNAPGSWIDVVAASVALAILTAVCARGVGLTTRVSLVSLVQFVPFVSLARPSRWPQRQHLPTNTGK